MNDWRIITCAALILFAIFSILHIQQPVAQDDLYYLVAAKTLVETGVPLRFGSPERIEAYSPELYLQVLVLAFRVFGVNEVSARLPGIMSGLLSIMMVFGITNALAQGTRIERLQWASLSAVLYALMPGTIQGALILAADNTILVPSILFLCWSFVNYQQEQKIRWAVLTGLAMMIALWGRVTTPLIVGCTMSIYVLAGRSSIKNKLVSVGALAVGAGLFVLTWYVYATMLDVPFFRPFTYAVDVFLYKARLFDLSQIAKDTMSLALWVGIFSVALFLVILGRRGAAFIDDRIAHHEDVFLGAGLSLLGGYLLVGGIVFGYPKYLAPAIPLLCAFAGIALSRNAHAPPAVPGNTTRVAFLLVLIACAVQIFTVGDWIYIFRYQMRAAMAGMMPFYTDIWKDIGLKAILFCAAFGLLFVVAWRLSFQTIIGILYVFALGSNVGVTFLHGTARYYTGYNHGGQGTLETAEYIRSRVPAESVVIVSNEVNYYLRMPHAPFWSNAFWDDPVQLTRRLADRNTSGLAYSVATNTIDQVHTLSTDESIQELLRHNYERATVGTYTIWIRKKAHSP